MNDTSVQAPVERSDSRNNNGGNANDGLIHDGQIDYDKSIRTLVEWLGKKGWSVKWYTSNKHVDAALLSEQLITISKRQILRHRYYSLLHEASHVDLLTGPVDLRHGEPHGYLDLWYKGVNERTLRSRIAVVIDEIDAWAHGIILATHLDLTIDNVKYRDFRNRNLKSYFEWALER